MKYALFLSLLAVGGSMGCGKDGKDKTGYGRADVLPAPVPALEADRDIADRDGEVGKATDLPRKIKYTSEIHLIVAELAAPALQLAVLVTEHKGYIAKSEESTSPGSVRKGMWRVRVPVEQTDAFRDAVRKLGDVEKNTTDSVDVTEEYYDLKNHIKNKLVEEEGLRDILKKTSEKNEKIESFLLVRDRLSEVRDYINRQEGRLRMLENLTDLATVTVYIRERKRFEPEQPPQQAETPTFGQRIGRTFTDSLDALVSLGKGLVLVVVGAGPWLVPLAIIGVPIWVLSRRRQRGAVPVAASDPDQQLPT